MAFDYWAERASGLLLPRPNFGSRRPCRGCCFTCVYFSERFARADSSDLGSDWTEVSGAWSISSQELVVSSQNAICKCNEANPQNTPEVVVDIDVTHGTAEGDWVRVIVDYQDSDNYYFADSGLFSANKSLRLGKRVAGVETILKESGITARSPEKIRVMFGQVFCITTWDEDGLNPWMIITDEPVAPTTDRVALGAGEINEEVAFDNLVLRLHNETNSACPGCQYPCTRCVGGFTPPGYDVTLGGVQNTGSCAQCAAKLNGLFVVINRNPGALPNECGFTYEDDHPCDGDPALLMISIWHSNDILVSPPPGGNIIIVTVQLHTPIVRDGTIAYFWEVSDETFDCVNIDLDLPLQDNTVGNCDLSAATCHIKARV